MAQSSQHPQKPSNIYIIGAQSSGKTTLTCALNLYFHNDSNTTVGALAVAKPLVLEEVAGKVLKKHGCTGQCVAGSKSRALELQTLILEAQYEAEDAIKDFWFISDRSGLDAIIYAKLYADEREVEQLLRKKEWKELENRLQNAVAIVCEPVPSWLEEDGLRFMPNDHPARIELTSKIHRSFCESLNHFGFKYVILPKTITNLDARVQFVVAKWKEMCGGPR